MIENPKTRSGHNDLCDPTLNRADSVEQYLPESQIPIVVIGVVNQSAVVVGMSVHKIGVHVGHYEVGRSANKVDYLRSSLKQILHGDSPSVIAGRYANALRIRQHNGCHVSACRAQTRLGSRILQEAMQVKQRESRGAQILFWIEKQERL